MCIGNVLRNPQVSRLLLTKGYGQSPVVVPFLELLSNVEIALILALPSAAIEPTIVEISETCMPES